MNDACRACLERYVALAAVFQDAAQRAGEAVDDFLRQQGIRPHAVEARSKQVESVVRKLRRRNYADPETEFTDRIGVRVILLRQNQIDETVALLRELAPAIEEHSGDKRMLLSIAEFGYRSVHLVVRLGDVLGLSGDERIEDGD